MPDNDVKSKYIPFSDPDEFLGHYGSSWENPKETLDFLYRFLDGMWIRNRHTETLCQVVSIGASGVYLGGLDYEVDWDKLYEDFEFLDGSPCGRKVDNGCDYKLKVDVDENRTTLDDIYGNAPIRNCHYGSDYVLDFKVGSRIEVNGANIKVVEDKTETDVCNHCIFKLDSDYKELPLRITGFLCDRSLCIKRFRGDGRNAHYEEGEK